MATKGQVTPDYIVTIIALGFIATIALSAYSNHESQALRTMEKLYVKGIADTLARGIDSVAVMGEGASKTIILEKSIRSGRDYNITLKGNAVLVRTPKYDYVSRYSTSSINGTNITLFPGELLIQNLNGTIYVQNVL